MTDFKTGTRAFCLFVLFLFLPAPSLPFGLKWHILLAAQHNLQLYWKCPYPCPTGTFFMGYHQSSSSFVSFGDFPCLCDHGHSSKPLRRKGQRPPGHAAGPPLGRPASADAPVPQHRVTKTICIHKKTNKYPQVPDVPQ